jgi:hypothetical protein
MTTSTVYTTATHTITSCKPTITNCPIGKVTTLTIPLYTTVCPVSAIKTQTAAPKPTSSAGNNGPGSDKTITTKVTKTYTITSCPPAVTNCPIGQVTTEVVTTTYCPGEETSGSSFQPQSPFHPTQTQTVVAQSSQPAGWNNGTSPATTVVQQPRPSASDVVCVGDTCTVESSTAAPESSVPTVVVSGAGKQSLSAMVVLGAVAAMLL